MDNRPTVFIGSSTEGLRIAEALKNQIGDRARVEIWNSDGVFSRNQSFLKSLLDASSLYEFAVLVFTSDDSVLMRAETHTAARDNILFEFGLFLGKLGPRRAHALVEKKLRVPSDLAGIHLYNFELNDDRSAKGGFSELAEKVTREILDYHENTVEFSHLPSTALAIGYFQNFIYKVCDELDNYKPITIDGVEYNYDNFTLNVVVADNLKLVDPVSLRSIVKGLKHVKVNSPSFRDFPFYIQSIPDAQSKHIEFFDIPTTMKASNETILRIFKEEYVGKSKLQFRAEQREIANFERTLRLLVDEVPAWKSHIKYRYLSEFIR